MPVPTITLPSGDEMPVVGLGTWDHHGETVRTSVRTALEGEYTHVDTAEGYQNEGAIGDALDDYDRDDVFLTSKVLPSNLDYGSVIEACEGSLARLGTDYLDLFLIHWPNPAISLRDTLHAMESLYDRGLVRNVGVSNFSAYQLSTALHISEVPIAVNQIEFHPLFQRPTLVEYCQDAGVLVEAAAPLARTKVLSNDTVSDLAEKYDKSPAQIVLRWAIQKDIVVIPKSASSTHIAENVDLFDWELTETDHQRLDALDRDQPVYDVPVRDWTGDVYGIPE
jgi:diketogulonate reductase-like aldo/keto reductase